MINGHMPGRRCRIALTLLLPLAIACRNDELAATEVAADPQAREVADDPPLALTPEMIVGGGGVHLALYDGGNASGPPIVLIQGFTGSYLSWERQLSGPLAREFHLVTYDFRGHGASEKPLDAASYTDGTRWADDLHAVIEARHLDRPVLVGWSYGGFVISDYIRRYGDGALGGVVFVGAVTRLGTPDASHDLTDEALAVFPDALSADLQRSIDGTRALTRMFANPLRGTLWERAYGSAMIVPPPVRGAMFSRVLDNDDVLAGIRVPALVIQGGADRIVRPSAAAHIAATVPGAKLLTYDGAGHAVQMDAPQRFARDLAVFVAAVRGSPRP